MNTNTPEYHLERARGEFTRRRMNEVIGSLLTAVELLQGQVDELKSARDLTVADQIIVNDAAVLAKLPLENSVWGEENQASYEASIAAAQEAGAPEGQPLENKTETSNSNIEITLSAVVEKVQQEEPKRGRGRPRKQ